MRTLALLVVASAAALPTVATAQHMNAEAFYKRAMALKKKGPLALMSKDLRPVVEEAKAAGEKARAIRLAAEAKGKQGRYCPPPGSKRIGNHEFLDGMTSLGAERAKIDMTEAMTRLLIRKHPCKKG
ncbi:hypothetical protein [Sphingomonas sp. LY160]|uniref:hypothetical protein n=1 Tax=Sphingomonas sp. LY160 TaxID=3095342 RepID=UPI002ADECCD9|nr:hypothetical protein [Sphingomonas sp. LY160]MEA1072085.1 hypothetical protein [Sphingomonas sp. LY160]